MSVQDINAYPALMYLPRALMSKFIFTHPQTRITTLGLAPVVVSILATAPATALSPKATKHPPH
jgi:hypothetical protein